MYFSAKSWFLKYKSGLLHGHKMKIVNNILRVGVHGIDVTQGRHKWRADVNRVMKLRVP